MMPLSSSLPSSSLIAVLDCVGPHTPIVPLLDYVARLEHVADAVTASLYTNSQTEASRREQYIKGVMIRAARAEEQNGRLEGRNEALLRENVAREREIGPRRFLPIIFPVGSSRNEAGIDCTP